MVLNKHRHRADRFLDPIARKLPNTNPDTLSWLAIVFALLGGLAIFVSNNSLLPLATLLIFISSYLDGLDGKVAKIHGKASVRGDFLDHTLDRYADIFMILGITFSAYCAQWIGVFALVGVLMTSYMGTQAQALGAGRDYGGLLGRSERQILLIITPLVQYLLNPSSIAKIAGFTVFEFTLILFAVAGNFTAVHRGIKAWRQLS